MSVPTVFTVLSVKTHWTIISPTVPSTRGGRPDPLCKDIRKEFPVPYVLYVDSESFLQPSEDKNAINEHVPSGFCCLKVSKFDNEIFPQHVDSEPDVMSHFYQHIYSEQETICEKLGIDKDMLRLTDGEKAEYQSSTTCPNCKNPFDQNWRKK